MLRELRRYSSAMKDKHHEAQAPGLEAGEAFD